MRSPTLRVQCVCDMWCWEVLTLRHYRLCSCHWVRLLLLLTFPHHRHYLLFPTQHTSYQPWHISNTEGVLKCQGREVPWVLYQWSELWEWVGGGRQDCKGRVIWIMLVGNMSTFGCHLSFPLWGGVNLYVDHSWAVLVLQCLHHSSMELLGSGCVVALGSIKQACHSVISRPQPKEGWRQSTSV